MSAPWWVPRTFALGLAALGAQMLAALYNAYLPIFYGAFVASNVVIGLIMVVDNIATLTVQPYFASLSDRVDTRLGRRMPFLLIGMPIAALAFLLIPRGQSFLPLFLATVMVNIGGAIFSSPSYALMPDITPQPLRSRANGIINVMGGLGAFIAFFYLSKLYRQSRTLPFDVAALLMVAALVIILLVIRERRLSVLYRDASTHASASDAVQVGRILPAARMVVQNRDRTILFLMLGALAWVAAVNGIQNMFTRYGMQHLGLDPSGATFLLGFFAAAFIVFSIPGGFIGDRIGRLKAIRLGAAGTLGALVAVSVIREPALFRIILIAAGLCWALAITNAYPFLVDRVPANQAGTYTGLWTATIGLAGLISPPIYGLVVDTFGFGAFFVPGIVFMAAGLVCTLGITEGSRGPDADAG
ncbi:MAG: MFS transporter [bacterium]